MRSIVIVPSGCNSPGYALHSRTSPVRSAWNVTVSRAPSCGAPSSIRPRNASRGRKATASGRRRRSDPHANQVTSSPAVTARPVGAQSGWFTGTRTSRASAATVTARSRRALPSTGAPSPVQVEGPDGLARRQPPERGNRYLDREAPPGLQGRGGIAEALHLLILGGQAHDRVVHQVD